MSDDVEEVDEETHALMTADFEMGELIKQRLIPRAVLYFTGEGLDSDDEYDDEEEDEEDGEGDDDDDEDEDSDDDANEGQQKKVAFRNGKRSAGAKGQTECKPQWDSQIELISNLRVKVRGECVSSPQYERKWIEIFFCTLNSRFPDEF